MKKNIFLTLLLVMFSLSSVRATEANQEEHPVIILGGGVAAMTAATYLARAGITPVVITGPFMGGTITQSVNVQNWPGEFSISGLDLSEKVKKQAEENGTIFVPETVLSVDFSKRPFTITTRKLFGGKEKQQKTYQAQAVIIALGSTPNLLNIPGEIDYWVRGVYNCAVCDGALYKDKVVAVVGGGDSALTEAQYLSNIAKKVHVFVRKEEFRSVEKERMKEILSRQNVEVHYQTTLREIKGDGNKVTHLLARDPSHEFEVPVDALFLAIGAKPNTEMFKGQLELDAQGYIVLKKYQQTSLENVYAVGDVVDTKFKQAITAAGDAAKAALQLQEDLVAYQPSTKIAADQKQEEALPPVIEVTSKEQFDRELNSANSLVFVDFYGTHCGPCRLFSPLYETWAKEYRGKAKFLKVNADIVPEVFATYQIRVIPTVVVFDEKGNKVRSSSGFREIGEIEKRLEKVKGQAAMAAQDFR